MTVRPAVHLAVALEGTGWHPAAWREDEAPAGELFTAGYWTDVVREAERGLLDFVTIEDSLGHQSSRAVPDDRAVQVRGRLDAALIASRVAPRTVHVGLVPAAVVTHTEPFHISKSIATLDYVSSGRAGWQVAVSSRQHEAGHFGRRDIPASGGSELLGELFEEAADYVEVVRRLWDSWEDDAEIRDVATGRFLDREKLHYIDFHGKWFSVKGPSITPRPPQGQPLVTTLANDSAGYRLAARAADVVFATPHAVEEVHAVEREVRAKQAESGRENETLHVFGDLLVFLDERPGAASIRKARLDELAANEYTFDAPVFTGTPEQLADQLVAWAEAGLSGFRLRPGAIPHDLRAITRGLVPELQRRGRFRREYDTASLRELLGLHRPVNRYVA